MWLLIIDPPHLPTNRVCVPSPYTRGTLWDHFFIPEPPFLSHSDPSFS